MIDPIVPHKRSKRFIALAIGAAAGALGAGIYNKMKNEEINKMIEEACAKNKHMLNLIKNQTSIY